MVRIGEAVRFLVTGVVSAATDLGLLFVLHEWVGVPLVVAVCLAFVTALCVNFLMHQRWTFRHPATGSGAQLARYLMLVAVNLLVTNVAVVLLVAVGVHYLFAKAACIVVIAATNLFVMRLWVFRASDTSIAVTPTPHPIPYQD